MAIRFTTTQSTSKFINCLVDGPSGIGKTRLCATAPKPLIISAEKGLLSLKDFKIPVIEVSNHIDLQAAYDFVTTNPKAAGFMTICLDSISDIAESCLAWFKENPVDGNTHPQAAYGHMADAIIPLIKKFRDIENKHIYTTAKIKRVSDQYTGIDTFLPSAPGQIIGPALPYLFDFILPMRIAETESGKKYRYLQTQPDLQYHAKDRSGELALMEEPHLGKLFAKALGIPYDPSLIPLKTNTAVVSETEAKKIKEAIADTPADTPADSGDKKEDKKPQPTEQPTEQPAEQPTEEGGEIQSEESNKEVEGSSDFPGENGEFPE